jgi:hypothetical protein
VQCSLLFVTDIILQYAFKYMKRWVDGLVGCGVLHGTSVGRSSIFRTVTRRSTSVFNSDAPIPCWHMTLSPGLAISSFVHYRSNLGIHVHGLPLGNRWE